MNSLIVRGGIPLNGEVTISGSKHSALAVLGSVLIMKGKVTLENFPNISDALHMLEILKSLGVGIQKSDQTVTLEVEDIAFSENEIWRIPMLRSSILFLGSILLRLGHVKMPIPGGDKLGNRPLEEFLNILDIFEIQHKSESDYISAKLSGTLRGNRTIDLVNKKFPVMGNNRTALALMMAWANRGRTTLKSAVILPEIIELCYFLEEISEGYVSVDGIGTDCITINSPGIDAIHSHSVREAHLIGPDKCEYAFWIAAASLTQGDITLNYPRASRDFRNTMRWVRAKLLRPIGVPLEVLGYGLYRVNCGPGFRPKAFHLESTAHEHWGIAFDATPLYATMLFTAKGEGSYTCFKFKGERTRWAVGTEKIGAKYKIDDSGTLLVTGVKKLYAPNVVTLVGDDIRGASSLLLLALATHGEICLEGLEHISRGMENPMEKLLSLGAQIIDPS